MQCSSLGAVLVGEASQAKLEKKKNMITSTEPQLPAQGGVVGAAARFEHSPVKRKQQ
jgi:hypothetical protein